MAYVGLSVQHAYVNTAGMIVGYAQKCIDSNINQNMKRKQPLKSKCDLCLQKVRVVKVREDYWRLAEHGQPTRTFVLCAGSGMVVKQENKTR